MTIHLVHSLDKPRWNFQKAKWSEFSMEMDHVIQFMPPKVDNYERFIKLSKSIAKKHVPRGVRQTYIPGWNKNCENLYEKHMRILFCGMIRLDISLDSNIRIFLIFFF